MGATYNFRKGGLDMSAVDSTCDMPMLRYYKISMMILQVVSCSLKGLCRLVAAVYFILIHKQHVVVNGIVAVVNLFSRGVYYIPSKKMDPWLKTFRVIDMKPIPSRSIEEPEKSVHCDVLHDPGVGKRKIDVIFIHGLKGSLERTWTQGVWELKSRDKCGRTLLRRYSSRSCNNETQSNDINYQSPDEQTSLDINKEMDKHIEGGRNENVEYQNELIDQDEPIDQNEPNHQSELNDQNASNGQNESNNQNEPNHQSEPNHQNQSNDQNETDKKVSCCWPRDWLPQDYPGVRVIALNYTTDPYLWRPIWINKRCRTSMSERAWEMLHHLTDLGVGEQPIVWVGHSKGGLFVKQMLVHATESNDPKFIAISKNSGGILFYSVPHRGSPLANLNLPLLRQSIELTEVQKDSAEVTALHRRFRELLDSDQLSVEVRSFIETTLTLMSLVYVRIVSVESADAEIGELYGVPIDHRNICKPRNRNCFLYQELLSLIDSIVKSHS